MCGAVDEPGKSPFGLGKLLASEVLQRLLHLIDFILERTGKARPIVFSHDIEDFDPLFTALRVVPAQAAEYEAVRTGEADHHRLTDQDGGAEGLRHPFEA